MSDIEVDSEYQRLYLSVKELRNKLANWLPEVTSEINVGSAPIQSNRAKLPKVEIPVFTGELEKWVSFAQMFIANIDSDPAINDAVKLTYLKGEPLQLIQGFEIVEANYGPAWETLRSRYDNARVTESHYSKILKDLPEARRELTSLKTLLNKVTVALDALNTLGLSADSLSDRYFAFVVLTKLDFYTSIACIAGARNANRATFPFRMNRIQEQEYEALD